MSDGDRIPGFSSRRWSNVYRKMSERYAHDLSLADDVMRSLKKDIQDYGNPPLCFLREAAIQLDRIRNVPPSSVSWVDEGNFLDDLGMKYKYQYPEHKRGIEIVLRSCNVCLHKFRYEQSVIGPSSDVVMAEQYVQQIYSKNFVGKVDITSDADRYIVRERIDEIQGPVDNRIVSLATQMVEKEDVKKLRVIRLAPKEHITHETDIFLEVENAIA